VLLLLFKELICRFQGATVDFQELRGCFQGVAVVLFFKNLDVVFKMLLWCYCSRTEMSFSMCYCCVVFQELRCRFQCVAVVLLFKNLDIVFKVLLWCCFSRT
jgi:hypothetical protein